MVERVGLNLRPLIERISPQPTPQDEISLLRGPGS